MVIDFYGLPGSGKTYLANKLVNNYKKNNYKASNIIEFERGNIFWKIYVQILKLFMVFNKTYRNEIAELKFILKEYKTEEARFNNVQISYYIKRLVYLRTLYKRQIPQKNFLIYDEGILQLIITIAVNYDLPNDLIKKLIDYNSKILSNIITVYNSISIENCIESIIQRNRHVCYIDELDNVEREIFLRENYKIAEEICKLVDSCIVERNDDDANKIKLITERSKSLFIQ